VIWLASASPRRRALLESAGHVVGVHPADLDERRHPAQAPPIHATRLATEKARTAPTGMLALGADTVVHRDGEIFEKPGSRHEAAAHLRALAGRWHAVTTGVCVRREAREIAFAVTTAVRFRALTADEIARYLATGEADDKAGAYGIQGAGGALVAEIQGSYTNVVGLPLEQALAALASLA
jgi:septum formation protein